jgi:hypothetical protein
MKNTIISFLISLLFFASCKKLDIANGTPHCVKRKIRNFEKQASCADAHVDQYEFETETVYVFSEGTCGADMSAAVIDSKCNSKGQLGGIVGNTKINGQEFSTAKFIKTVWKK